MDYLRDYASLALGFAAATLPVFFVLPTIVFYIDPSLAKAARRVVRLFFYVAIADFLTCVAYAAWWVNNSGGPGCIPLTVIMVVLGVVFSIMSLVLLDYLSEHAMWKSYELAKRGPNDPQPGPVSQSKPN